jgi:two-component system nitrate/nitrite sensor histidine kinase NarX
LPPSTTADPVVPNSVLGDASGILVELTAGLAAGDDVREVFEHFLPSIVQVAGARAGAVRALDSHGQHKQLVGEFGLPALAQAAERAAGGELLAVPLARRGRVLGEFDLYFDAGRQPSGDVQALLGSIGGLLALALDNARLERENLHAALASERQAIAAEVHDSIGQSLAYVKMRLPLLQDAIRGCDQDRAEGYFDDVRSAIRDAHGSLRAVLEHMRAPMDPLGFGHALAAAAEAFRRQSGATLEVVDGWAAVRLAPAQEAQVFHIVQEALSNIARHAAASHAWLRLACEGDFLAVSVEDDGQGLPPTVADGSGSHYGLSIMRERARRLGGMLDFAPGHRGGTVVSLRFPARGSRGPATGVTARSPDRRAAAVQKDPQE